MSHAGDVADAILEKFDSHVHLEYGERVTLRGHMLQSAVFAQEDGANDLVVVATLLHDIGHFLHELGEDIADQGVDGHHEELGAAYLKRHFPGEVVEPTRLHVAAKRYLCATDRQYLQALSPASLQSLELQGGPFSAEEVQEFKRHPYFQLALQVRRYDEAGKVPGMQTPTIEDYRELIERAVVTSNDP